ncbi:MAG: hypothetical protein LUE19_04150 [Clostridiales bacterium]|nr:hypothetical protein [Clostridiales bacterium]
MLIHDTIICSKQRSYKILKPPMIVTNGAEIYKAAAVGTDEREDGAMSYILKRYIGNEIPDALERERRKSVEIHEKLQVRDAVIPISEIDEEKQYAIMEFKGHGEFLNELILKLEEKNYYGKDKISVQLDMLEQILLSLEAIHFCADKEMQTSGYVHLDLHPGNIFFESTDIENGQIGSVKFIDFLSARPLLGNRILPDDFHNEVIASPAYAAPEYAEGCLSSVCRATDLYSVGKIFCRMLLGGVMESWEEDCLKYNIETVGQTAGSRLEAVILTFFIQCALDPEPKYRFRTAGEMRKAVRRMQTVFSDCSTQRYYAVLDYLYETQLFLDESVLDGLEFNPEQFDASVKKLAGILKSDSFNPSKCYFIFTSLRCFLHDYERDREVCGSVKNLLLESGIACCNHTGRTKEAYELYGQLMSGLQLESSSFDLWRYWGLINRVAVSYADSFRWEEAFGLLCDKIIRMEEQKRSEDQKMAAELQMDPGDYAFRRKELARAYSGAGCYLALRNHQMKADEKTADRDGNTPLDYFRRALEEFGKEDPGNCQITVSHILHYAVEINDRDLFEKYALDWHYFGSEDEYGKDVSLSDSLKLLLEKGSDAVYLLHIFLKGVYAFYEEKTDALFAKILRTALTDDLQKFHKNHPVELVFRYVALILSKAGTCTNDVGMVRDAEYAFLCAMKFVPEARVNFNCPIGILTCITYQTMYLYHICSGQKEQNEGLYDDFKEHCNRTGEEELLKIYDSSEKLNDVLSFYYT